MRHTLHLKNDQLEDLLVIVIFEFKDPFKGLNPIKIALRVKIAIKFWSLNFEILKIIPRMP